MRNVMTTRSSSRITTNVKPTWKTLSMKRLTKSVLDGSQMKIFERPKTTSSTMSKKLRNSNKRRISNKRHWRITTQKLSDNKRNYKISTARLKGCKLRKNRFKTSLSSKTLTWNKSRGRRLMWWTRIDRSAMTVTACQELWTKKKPW